MLVFLAVVHVVAFLSLYRKRIIFWAQPFVYASNRYFTQNYRQFLRYVWYSFYFRVRRKVNVWSDILTFWHFVYYIEIGSWIVIKVSLLNILSNWSFYSTKSFSNTEYLLAMVEKEQIQWKSEWIRYKLSILLQLKPSICCSTVRLSYRSQNANECWSQISIVNTPRNIVNQIIHHQNAGAPRLSLDLNVCSCCFSFKRIL